MEMLDDDETGLYGESASTRERTQIINSITLNKTKTLQFEVRPKSWTCF